MSAGISAVEVYIPNTYVDSKALFESNSKLFNSVSSFQNSDELLSCVGDNEDLTSFVLSVSHNLIEKYSISPSLIGNIEITSSMNINSIDLIKCKSNIIKFFNNAGNSEILCNACFDSSVNSINALFNTINYVDSSSWDGRYSLVIAVDLCHPGNDTTFSYDSLSGCAAVAILIGRDSPIKLNLKTRSVVSSSLSLSQMDVDEYCDTVDKCYQLFTSKREAIDQHSNSNLNHFDFISFATCNCDLLRKSIKTLVLRDIHCANSDLNKSEDDIDIIVDNVYTSKAEICSEILQNIGNCNGVTSLLGLAYMISTMRTSICGKNILLFFNSNDTSIFIEANVSQDENSVTEIGIMSKTLSIRERLAARMSIQPAEFFVNMESLGNSASNKGMKSPRWPQSYITDGSYYIDVNGELTRRENHSLTNSLPIDTSVCRSNSTDSYNIGNIGSGNNTPTTNNFYSNSLSSSSSNGGGLRRNKTYVWASGRPGINVVVTGVAAALPGRDKDVFKDGRKNIYRIIQGEQLIDAIPDQVKTQMLARNVVQLKKNKDGTQNRIPITKENNINLCASLGHFDLTKYGVAASIAATMDRAVQVAVAAGLEALKDAGIVSGTGEGTSGWELPASMQDSFGIVYATSFPALDAAVEEVSRYFRSKSVNSGNLQEIVATLRKRMEAYSGGALSSASDEALKEIERLAEEVTANPEKDAFREKPYEFDRKFLFRVLVLGNGQLAQIVKARGPNMQTNAACAGSTQAVALAFDLIQTGRAERVVVIAGDNASSDTLMPWLGNGFRALGAATSCGDVNIAALPFDQRRSGMILGSGGIGMVFESEEGARRRQQIQSIPSSLTQSSPFRCRLLGTLYSNSAYHGAAMDRNHISQEMERFISGVEAEHNITRQDIAKYGVYFSHETSTHASPTSSCAANEIHGLRTIFGEDLKNLLILNTKGFTGHPMGVSFEDVVATEVLFSGMVPPIANDSQLDPNLGTDLKLSRGGNYPCKYAMRFAAGFGSQIAIAIYGIA